jgi:hypothetical protein
LPFVKLLEPLFVARLSLQAQQPREVLMNEDIIERLNAVSQQLRRRSLELANPDDDRDLSLIMQGLAITMEAVSALGAAVKRLDGLQGLGRAGD